MLARRIALCLATLATLAVVLPTLAGIRTAPELLDAMLAAEQARAEGVSNYAMDVVVMNHMTTQYFERAQMDAAEGRSVTTFRLVSFGELQQRVEGEPGLASADMQAFLKGVAAQSEAALGGAGSRGFPSAMRRGAGRSEQDAGPWGVHDAERMQRFIEQAQIVGLEQVAGRDAHHVRADGLNIRQVSDGQVFEIRAVSMWVDARDLVMLKMHMEGQIEQDGQAREMFLEKIDEDFRIVPGSRLLLPFRSVMRMGGLLGPKEQQEMEKARAQLAQLDQQMAAMPPEQKRMMESMMSGQMDTLRKMVEGGAFEIETTVRDVRVNSGIAGAVAGAADRAASLPRAPRSGSVLGTVLSAASGAAAGGTHAQADAHPALPAQADPAALKRAREECLQEKAEKARAATEKKKKKRRFGKLLGAVGRVVSRHAGAGLVGEVGRITHDVYDANATAKDLKTAADALGISVEEVADCETPASGGAGE